MSTDEKAKQLFAKFYAITCNINDTIKCCNICIDEALAECNNGKKWWLEVKKIINNEKNIKMLLL